MFDIVVSCLVLTALLAYVNLRYIGLPTSIGVMGIAMLISFALVGLDGLGIGQLRRYEQDLVRSINFSDVLMQGMLSLLLFAGALELDLPELRAVRWQVGALAALGTVASTLMVGFAIWLALPLMNIDLGLPYCLIFGALISPTDPIAVMGILKSAGAPKRLESVIAGESLFNDGIGVVLFSLLLTMVTSGQAPTFSQGLGLLAQEAGGGVVFGLALGYLTFVMLRSIDSYPEEVLITLAAVLGGYALASRLHFSGPLAMVVVGLFIGNHGRSHAMSSRTRESLDMFWELIDTILNAVLFVLIGLQVILIPPTMHFALASVLAILVTLAARFVIVAAPLTAFRRAFALPVGSWQVLTWGGLRGGISVALALSLPEGPAQSVILSLTYSVVVFSILGQGMSISTVVAKSIRG